MVFWYFLSGNHLGAGRLLSLSPSPPQTARDRAHFGPWTGKQVTELAKQQGIRFGANFCNALQCCLPAKQLAAWPKGSNQGPAPGEFPLTKALQEAPGSEQRFSRPSSNRAPPGPCLPPPSDARLLEPALGISPPGHTALGTSRGISGAPDPKSARLGMRLLLTVAVNEVNDVK